MERALNRRSAVEPRAAQAVNGRAVRVGVLGPFSGLLSFAHEHFTVLPEAMEMSVFDLEMKDRLAPYLAPLVSHYEAFGEGSDRAAAVAQAVNRADLDCLLLIHRGPEAQAMLDRIETPCVVNVCTGSDLMHHERVGAQLFVQPQADYFMRGDRLFCGTNRAYFPDDRIYRAFILFDRRGLNGPIVPVAERDPLVVFHGALYKLASPPFLELVFRLLAEDTGLEFVYVGGRNEDALALINRAAKAHHVADRVHYDGEYSGVRGDDGELDDPGWARLVALLQRARFAPNPWPMGGASALIETYASGVPTAHMSVRTDSSAWGRRQHAVAEVEAILIPEATATTIDGYLDVARRCLYDESFAELVVGAQLAVVDRATAGPRYWDQLLDVYSWWARRTRAVSTTEAVA